MLDPVVLHPIALTWSTPTVHRVKPLSSIPGGVWGQV